MDLIEDGKTGLFCNAEDPHDMADKIFRLYEDKALRQQLALSHTYRKELFYIFAFELEHPETKRGAELIADMTRTDFHIVALKGRSVTEKTFYLIHYGDYVTYYLGKLKSEDPADWGIIEEFKRKLAEECP